MSDINYSVEVEFFSKGRINAPMGDLQKVNAQFASMSSAASSVASSIGSSFAGALGGVLETVSSIGMGLAKLGAAGAVGAMTYGVMGLNDQLEQSRISIAAAFQANGITDSFNDSLLLAS